MATARTAPAGSRSSERLGPPRRGGPPARVRWDRVGRLAMLFVLLVLLYLYISPVRSLISAFHQSAAQRSDVAGLERTTTKLLAERAALRSTSALTVTARKQGLVRPGEKEFVIFGLPAN